MAVDFIPTMGDYQTLQPFRYWCQKVLPLVYDDSLSYYELLCKVVDYLNKTMEDVETLHGDVEDLLDAYTQLQTYVNNYFENLDVQNEINNKLDAMALDGSLSTLLAPYIPSLVSAWLDENITPTTPAIDASLSVSGAGADAKVTGDKVTQLHRELKYGYYDVIELMTKPSSAESTVDLRFDYDETDETYTIAGTKSGSAFIWFQPNTAIPFGIEAGATYFIDHTSTNVYFEIWVNDSTRVASVLAPVFVTIPENATKVAIRLATWNANNINETIPVPKMINVKAYNDPYIHISPDTFYTFGNRNAISDALAIGDVMLESGEYEVPQQITIPSGKTLRGCGANTVLKYTASGISFINCFSGNETISDLTIKSTLTEKPTTYNTPTPISGIRIYGETDAPAFISNVSVIGFSKNGILIDNKGYTSLCSIIGNNIFAQYCGAGICFAEHGEYGVLENVVAIDNYYGIIDSGGNNKIANCGFDRNTTGFFATNVNNDTHSDVIGCSFNHCTSRGIDIVSIQSMLTFTGCQVFSSGDFEVAVYASKGVSFVNCLFGLDAVVGFNKATQGSEIYMMNNCIFANTPTVTITENTLAVLDNCYTQNGESVTG